MSEATAYGPVEPDTGYGPVEPAATPTQPDPAEAGAYLANSSELTPEQAAEAMGHANMLGLAPDWVGQNLDAVRTVAKERQTQASLARAPHLAAYMAKGPTPAALAKDDVGVLEALEQGFLDIGYGAIATSEMTYPTKSGEEILQNYEADTEAFDKRHSGIFAHVARDVPTIGMYFLSGKLGEGLGKKPGEVLATGAMMYAMTRGALYRQIMREMPIPESDAEGVVDPVEYEQRARAYATGGAAASAALGAGLSSAVTLAVPGAAKKIQSLSTRILARAFTDPATRDIVARLTSIGGHTLSGALYMAVPAVVNDATVQKAVTGEIDAARAAEAGWEAFKSATIAAGALASIPHAVPLLRDVGRITSAVPDAAKLDHLAEQAKASKLVQRSPAEAEALIRPMATASETPNVFVDLDAVAKDPKMLAAVSDAAGHEAIAEAQATGGAVAIPTEKYLVRLADQHDALRENVKTDPEGMTLREADARAEELTPAPGGVQPRDLAPILDNDIRVAQLTGDELAGLPRNNRGGVLVSAFKDWLKDNAQGSFLNSHTRWIIDATMRGLKEVAAYGREVQGVAPALREMLLDAVLHHSAADQKGRADVAASHVFYAPVAVGDELFRVAIRVNETRGSFKFYMISPERMERPTSSGASAGTTPTSAPWPPGTMKVKDLLAGVKAPEPPSSGDAGGGAGGTSPANLSAKALAEIAATRIESQRLGDIHPGRYEQDARRAADRLAKVATEAAKEGTSGARSIALGTGLQAASEGPTTGAATTRAGATAVNRAERGLAEVPQLEGQRDFARELAKASTDVREEAESNRKFLLRYTKDEVRAELGKAGGQYLEQVDRLLSGFELGQGASRGDVARRQATMDWLAREQAANRDPIIPDSVLAKLDRFVHWKEMTPQELRDLRASIESIAHVAKLKNTLIEKQARVDRGRGMEQLVTALRDNTVEKPFRPRGTVVANLQKALDSMNGLAYGLRAVERIVNVLDGNDINGPWHRYVWDPINDGTNRWHDITRRTTDAIAKTLNEMPSEDKQRWRETRFNAAGQKWDATAAIAVALNQGNESNARKLLEGWQDPSVARRGMQLWDESTPEEFLRHLTRKDWEFVQTVWDRLESMWPESADLEKRLSGLAPPKVKPRPFTRTLEDGTTIDLRGGYYPVIYDPDFSRVGAASEEQAALRSVQLFDQNYYRAATPQGRLQQRIEGFSRPVLLTLDNLPGKISEAAKDVAMREALISVHSALTDDSLRAALHTSELGRAGEKALLGWLRDTANDLVVPDNGSGPWFTMQNKTRSGYTASLFAYNAAQTWQNLTSIIPATKAVGGKWMAQALTRFAKNRSALVEWVDAQSGEMRNEDKGGQILSEAIREAAQGKGLTTGFMRFGVNMFRATDLAIKYPAWLGDYTRSTALVEDGGRGLSHEEAVKHADATVRLNVMANNTKDLPALLRNRVGRWMLPLYSYSMHRLNMMGDAIGGAQRLVREHKTGTAAALLGGVWGTLAGEAVLSEIVKGNGPQDENGDGEVTAADWAIWTARVSVTAPLTWLPFIGNSIRVAATGRDPLTAPEVSVFASAGRTARDAYTVAAAELAGEEVDDAAIKRLTLHLVETGGYLGGAFGGGLPVSQVRASAGYLLDENSPKDTPLQIGLGVAFGKKRPGKLLNLTE